MRNVVQLTSVKALPFIFLVAVFGWCCLLAGCATENDEDSVDHILFVSCYHDEDDHDHVICVDVDRDDFYFSPNDDDINDFFIVKSSNDQQQVSLKIYTRAGVLVYSISAQQCVWDGYSLNGQPMANGVYYYTAEILDTPTKVLKSGFLYLYR